MEDKEKNTNIRNINQKELYENLNFFKTLQDYWIELQLESDPIQNGIDMSDVYGSSLSNEPKSWQPENEESGYGLNGKYGLNGGKYGLNGGKYRGILPLPTHSLFLEQIFAIFAQKSSPPRAV